MGTLPILPNKSNAQSYCSKTVLSKHGFRLEWRGKKCHTPLIVVVIALLGHPLCLEVQREEKLSPRVIEVHRQCHLGKEYKQLSN